MTTTCIVKTFGLLQPLFQLSQLHVCGVRIMKFKDHFQSSEDLEIKTLRRFSLIKPIFFSEDQTVSISGKGLVT